MINPSIEVLGLRELESALLDLGAAVAAKELRGSLMDAATVLVDDMKANAREDDGFLIASISKRSKLNKSGSKNTPTVTVIVGPQKKGGWKAGFQEFGTPNKAAKPFVRPALINNVDTVLDFTKKRLARRIELARKRAARKKAAGTK